MTASPASASCSKACSASAGSRSCEGGNIIGLSQGGAALSLEPGGQFELSGAPLKNVHETCAEVNTHLDQVREVCAEIGAGCLGVGFAPTWTLAETPVMPKGRYEIMRSYMPKVGGYGLEMMFRTCTVQVNFDFGSEADMVKKFRVALALQPIATALFANSPFREGRPNGFLSYRSHIWTDVDNARSGMLPFVFEDGFGFERYVDYALDVPMYFVYRDGKYIDVAGKIFRDFLAGKIPELAGITPMMSDWADHLTTIFPEVRLKTLSRDARRRRRHVAAHLRHCRRCGRACSTTRPRSMPPGTWSRTGRRKNARRCARACRCSRSRRRSATRTCSTLARRMLTISTAGLDARAPRSAIKSEKGFLEPLAGTGRPRADAGRGVARLYQGRMEGRSLPPVRGLQFPLTSLTPRLVVEASSPLRQRQPPSVFFHAT